MEIIKALRAATGMGLAELKPIVDQALPPSWQANNARLREEAADFAENLGGSLVRVR